MAFFNDLLLNFVMENFRISGNHRWGIVILGRFSMHKRSFLHCNLIINRTWKYQNISQAWKGKMRRIYPPPWHRFAYFVVSPCWCIVSSNTMWSRKILKCEARAPEIAVHNHRTELCYKPVLKLITLPLHRVIKFLILFLLFHLNIFLHIH